MKHRRIIEEREARFISRCRIGHLGTTGVETGPHVVPVCFALYEDKIYTPIDGKPKTTIRLRRLLNIQETGSAALLFNHYDEDWSKLAWVLVRGNASAINESGQHLLAVQLLRDRYEQYLDMPLEDLPIIVIEAHSCASWGVLETSSSPLTR